MIPWYVFEKISQLHLSPNLSSAEYGRETFDKTMNITY